MTMDYVDAFLLFVGFLALLLIAGVIASMWPSAAQQDAWQRNHRNRAGDSWR